MRIFVDLWVSIWSSIGFDGIPNKGKIDFSRIFSTDRKFGYFNLWDTVLWDVGSLYIQNNMVYSQKVLIWIANLCWKWYIKDTRIQRIAYCVFVVLLQINIPSKSLNRTQMTPIFEWFCKQTRANIFWRKTYCCFCGRAQ